MLADVGAQVAVHQRDHVPDEREAEPAHAEREREDEQIVAPLEVDERGEEVVEVAAAALVDVAARYVDVAVLEEEALLLLLTLLLLLGRLRLPRRVLPM